MKNLKPALSVPGLLVLAASFAGPASAETKGELEKRVSALEAKLAAAPDAAAVKTLLGFDVSIYGYAHGALVIDDTYDLGLNAGGIGGVLPTTNEDENSRLHAYQSRLGLRGSKETDAGKLSFNIEGDFYGGGGGTFRLRHAYGSLGGLLVGQTWSAFGPVEGSPSGQIDFGGPAGNPSWRTAQIRYTYKFSDKFSGIVSVEEDNKSSYADRVALVGALHWVDGKTRRQAGRYLAQAGMVGRHLGRMGRQYRRQRCPMGRRPDPGQLHHGQRDRGNHALQRIRHGNPRRIGDLRS